MRKASLVLFAAIAAIVAPSANAEQKAGNFFEKDFSQPVRVRMDGLQETPAALFTTGRGAVRLVRRKDAIDFVLRYRDLEGDVTASAGVHIHFGRPGLNGGIAAFLCEAAAVTAPPGTPLCTDNGSGSGVVRGRITASDVLPIEGQGFPAGDLDALWDIIEDGAAYVNLHTDKFPAGEIRGDIPARKNRF